MKGRNTTNLALASYDDIFQTDEGREDALREKVTEIQFAELYPFENHPFKVRDDEAMQDMAESVMKSGVLVLGVARPRKDGGYELVAVHRRKRACELAGLETMPVLVRELDDDEAILVMVDSNLQRETLEEGPSKNMKKSIAPPKLYDLTTLQREANRMHGFTSQQTLDYVQSLYEKKLSTYPRTDSRYLTEDMAAGIPALVEAVTDAIPFTKGMKPTVEVKRVIDNKKSNRPPCHYSDAYNDGNGFIFPASR